MDIDVVAFTERRIKAVTREIFGESPRKMMRRIGRWRVERDVLVDVKVGKKIIAVSAPIDISVEVTGITLDTEMKIHLGNRVFVVMLSETLDGDEVFYLIDGEHHSRSDWLKLLCRSQQ